MAVASVGEAALGASFLKLYNVVNEVIEQTTLFKSFIGEIKSLLDSLQPAMGVIPEELDLPEEELQNLTIQMKEGVQLIHKCSKVSKWNTYKRHKCTNKLGELGKSLKRLLDILKTHGTKDAKKTLVTEKNIETRFQQIDENFVIQNNPSEKIEAWSAVPEPPSLTVGLEGPLEELKLRLLKDGLSMLVLTAPGGCGKTTLATKFCQDAEVRDKFKNNIFFVTVSKKRNLTLIVQELYQRKNSQVLDFQTEVIAVDWLQEFLKQTDPLLLVLDDVWSESEVLLEKFDELKISNHKILVTSRFAFPRFGSPYYLQTLKEEDAMALFYHSASLGERSSYVPEDLSRKIVEHCKGFPLAITVVGGSLCGKPLEVWQKRVTEWTKGSSILYSDHDLLICLQSSLDALVEENIVIKECFIDLGSFPEDQRISATILIDAWSELYKIDEDALCIINLRELTNRSLATLIVTRKDNMEVDGYYAEHFVTQHDILRELAIYQTNLVPIEQRRRVIIHICGDNFPDWWIEQKCQPISARILSISTDVDFSAKWPNMDIPQAEVLILNFQSKKYSLPEFVEKMDKLKVLMITNYGLLPAQLNNFPLLGSLSNLKRIRLERISIPSISKDPVKLEHLEKISLFMCKVGQAFSNCSIQLVELFPNVVEINIDYCNDLVELPGLLCDLIALKKLSITNSHKLSFLPEEMGKLVNLEVLRLRSCTDLSELPDSIRKLKLLNSLDISDCFSMKELPEHIGEMCGLETLNMRQCSRLQELPASVVDLERLEDVICDEETEILWKPFLPIMQNIHIRKDNKDSDGYYTEHFVTHHDMLRELAIHQMSQEPLEQRMRLMIDICGDNLPMWWKEQKYRSLIARVVYISTDEDFSSKWENLKLPEAEIIIFRFPKGCRPLLLLV